MQEFLQVLFVSLGLGCIYGLVGLSFTVVYNVCMVLNFSLGDLVMLGAVFSFFFLSELGLPLVATVCLVLVIVGVLGVLVQYVAVNPLLTRQTPLITIIIGTMAAGMVMSGGAGVWTHYKWMYMAPYFGFGAVKLLGATLSYQILLIIISTGVLTVALWFLLHKTLFGRAIRAIGYNKEAASLVGIRILRMTTLTFFVCAVMASITGVLVAPIVAPNVNMGFHLVVKGWVAAVIGGMGNPYAAVAGGLILGAVGAFLTGYFSSAYAEIGIFFVLLVVLVFRPAGIFREVT